jgi:peroxiredoxin
VLTLVAFGLIGAFGVSSCNSGEVTTTTPPANRTTTTAPPRTARSNVPVTLPVDLPPALRDLPLKTIDGEALKLSDYADKVVVINLWATWCGPCRLEMPDLVKLDHEYKSRGLVVLGLSTSYNEQNDESRVRNYIRSQNVGYKILWDDGSLAAPLVQAVRGPSVIPQSFVISRGGRIVKHFPGFSPATTPPQMREAVEAALNDKGQG